MRQFSFSPHQVMSSLWTNMDFSSHTGLATPQLTVQKQI